MNSERILNQDIYYCNNNKIFDKKKYLGCIRREINDIIYDNKIHEKKTKTSYEISFDIQEYYEVTTFTDKIIKHLPIKKTKNKKYITIYKLEKGTKIPEGFDIVLDKFYHLNIIPTEPVKCKYHHIYNEYGHEHGMGDCLDYKCLTYDKITNLNWNFYGYIDKREFGDFSYWFIEKHKDEIFEGYISKCNYLDFIYSISSSNDVVNCVDSLFLPYLTKIKEHGDLFIYEFLKHVTIEYMFFSELHDMNADNDVHLLYESLEKILNKKINENK